MSDLLLARRRAGRRPAVAEARCSRRWCAVEEAWLAALVAAGVAPAAAADRSRRARRRPTTSTRLAAAAEAGGNPVIPLVALLRERVARSAPRGRGGCTAA